MDNIFNVHIKNFLIDFFDKKQIEELNSFYPASFSDSSSSKSFSDKNSIDSRFKEGLNFKAQTDLLITFSSNHLKKDKFVSLLLFLAQYATTNGEFSVAMDVIDKIISITSDNKDMVNITANAFLNLGEIYSRQANWKNSFENVKNARKLFESISDTRGVANCENLLGTIYGDMGDLVSADKHFEASLAKTQGDKNYALNGKIEINLGIINSMRGKFDEAIAFLKRALMNFEKIGDERRIAEIHQNLGMVYTKKSDYTSALKEFDLSLTYAIKSDYLQIIGFDYLSKAYVYSQIKDYSLASAFADKAMEIAYKLNDKLTIAEVYKIKGIIQRVSKNYSLAENYLLTSLRLNEEAGNKLNQAETYHELGLLYKDLNKMKESKEHLSKALEYFKAINSEPDIKLLESLLSFQK